VRDDRARLEDIRDAIADIEKRAPRRCEDLERDEMLRVWVLYHLQIIGEACRGLSEDFRRSHPEDIWSSAISFRNVLVHQYFGIDIEAVWQVIARDLPELRSLVECALGEDTPGSS
jgi:uncharacterized protein with HEPN domain